MSEVIQHNMSYDGKNDILVVHNGFENHESFKTNELIGDLVLDISTSDMIRGIEVMNASSFFGKFGLKKDDLANLKDVQLDTHGSLLSLSFLVKGKSAPMYAKINLN